MIKNYDGLYGHVLLPSLDFLGNLKFVQIYLQYLNIPKTVFVC